ncbi:MAG: glycosyltransferase [Candidatus Kapaibacterium sp.]
MDISVIIVNYNVKEFLRGALLSVERSLEHGALTGEIIVVDNASADDSARMVREEFPSVKLYALAENLGFGRANNLGMKHASGDYFLILNPDTIVGEDTLRVMVDFMRSHSNVGLAGCKLLNGDGTFQLSCRRGFPTPWASFTKLFGLSRFFPNSRLFARYNLTYLPIDETYEVDALGGAFMTMSRAAYNATGGFDEHYFMYGEDIDLCFQVKKQGFKVYYVPTTATIHFKGESTRRSSLNEVKVFYEAMHIFVKKNYGTSFFFIMMLRLGIVLRTMLAQIKKHRGVVLVAAVDFITVAFSVLLTSKLIVGYWFGLPEHDYPFAVFAPPVVVVAVLLLLSAYTAEDRRKIKPILIGMPAALIILSSLTYFFKEFASSRSLMLALTGLMTVALVLDRYILRFADRIRFGGNKSARPVMQRTLIVGTSDEAIRIGTLLRRTQFLRHYQVVGFVDSSLTRLNEKLLEELAIVGDTKMLAKLVRDERVSEVIFASDAVPYTEMLSIMQKVSEENPSRIVNFNVVPTASNVLLARKKIEVLTPSSGADQVAIIPVHFNIQRLSHRIGKRVLDVTLALLIIPIEGLLQIIRPTSARKKTLDSCWRVLRGELSLVGAAGKLHSSGMLSKSGLTSLAAITLPNSGMDREEDIEQIDLYYAQNHTIGMDLEIIIRSAFSRGKAKS